MRNGKNGKPDGRPAAKPANKPTSKEDMLQQAIGKDPEKAAQLLREILKGK